MKKLFTEEQIIGILKEAEAGMRLLTSSVNTGLAMRYAREIIENWRREYNKWRPLSSLQNLTPNEFASRF